MLYILIPKPHNPKILRVVAADKKALVQMPNGVRSGLLPQTRRFYCLSSHAQPPAARVAWVFLCPHTRRYHGKSWRCLITPVIRG